MLEFHCASTTGIVLVLMNLWFFFTFFFLLYKKMVKITYSLLASYTLAIIQGQVILLKRTRINTPRFLRWTQDARFEFSYSPELWLTFWGMNVTREYDLRNERSAIADCSVDNRELDHFREWHFLSATDVSDLALALLGFLYRKQKCCL